MNLKFSNQMCNLKEFKLDALLDALRGLIIGCDTRFTSTPLTLTGKADGFALMNNLASMTDAWQLLSIGRVFTHLLITIPFYQFGIDQSDTALRP